MSKQELATRGFREGELCAGVHRADVIQVLRTGGKAQ
jgi:hypothetical protein